MIDGGGAVGPPLVELRGVTKTYGQGSSAFTALHDVSLTIDHGESVAIIGKSGSGKSTLMHLLALLDTPSAGRLILDGADTTGLSASQVAHLRNQTFGFVFQQFFLIGSQSVVDNVALPLMIAGVGRAERTRRAMAALERLDMADKAKNRATALSSGQKQRVVIARALINEPSVIFADEPTGNLDSATGEVVEDILFDLHRSQGLTLVVVTHDPDLAARAGREMSIRDGRIDSDVRRSL